MCSLTEASYTYSSKLGHTRKSHPHITIGQTNSRNVILWHYDLESGQDYHPHRCDVCGGERGETCECVENRLRSCSSVGSRRGYEIVWRYWSGTSCPPMDVRVFGYCGGGGVLELLCPTKGLEVEGVELTEKGEDECCGWQWGIWCWF
jgi:hypothetical protein